MDTIYFLFIAPHSLTGRRRSDTILNEQPKKMTQIDLSAENSSATNTQIMRMVSENFCLDCGSGFTSPQELEAHQRQIHGYVAFCAQCKKGFRSENGYLYHKRMHDGGAVCTVCGKTTQSAAHLRRHMLTHSEKHNFNCGECGKAFKHRFQLTKHLIAEHQFPLS